MENNDRLNDLFNQAKNEAPKASYEQIKGQFEQSLISAGASASSGLLTLKNVIMIATITTISVATIMGIDVLTIPHTNETTEEPAKPENPIEEIHVEAVHQNTLTAYVAKVKRLDPVLRKEQQVEFELALKTGHLPSILSLKDSTSQREPKQDTSFRFPTLTPEEVKANNKQKAKMLKQLMKLDKKAYAYIPSGSMKLKGETVSVQAFHMQTTEVSNLEYRTFLFDLLIQGRKDEFMKARPIQKTWTTEYEKAFLKPMEEHYFSHPAYNYYPVVAIPREGAILYCKWLTQEVNKLNKAKGKPSMNDLRIPTDYEWMYAAKGGFENSPYPWGGPYLRNARGCYLANFQPGRDTVVNECANGEKSMDDVPLNDKNRNNLFSADGGFFQVKVDSYHPNEYGLYCMSGNVAEMVYYVNENNEPGTKGGSWSSISQELQIVEGKDRFKGQTKPSVNIGFRPVITFIGTSK